MSKFKKIEHFELKIFSGQYEQRLHEKWILRKIIIFKNINHVELTVLGSQNDRRWQKK
jgi:hypothetical protein